MKFNWKMAVIGFVVCMMFVMGIAVLYALYEDCYLMGLMCGICLCIDSAILGGLYNEGD